MRWRGGMVGLRGRTSPPAPLQMERGASRAMNTIIFQVNIPFEKGLGFSPLGETGEGFTRSFPQTTR